VFRLSISENNNRNRNPALFLFPGSTRLHFRISTSSFWNEGINSSMTLPLNVDSKITYTVNNNIVTQTIESVTESKVLETKSMRLKGSLPIKRSVYFFMCDNENYNVPNVEIRNMTYEILEDLLE